MKKISGKLLYSIERQIKNIRKWDVDGSATERYKSYLLRKFEICNNCNKARIYHSGNSLPFYFNGTSEVYFCDKKKIDRSLDRTFKLDPEATQIIHGVITVKYGISK